MYCLTWSGFRCVRLGMVRRQDSSASGQSNSSRISLTPKIVLIIGVQVAMDTVNRLKAETHAAWYLHSLTPTPGYQPQERSASAALHPHLVVSKPQLIAINRHPITSRGVIVVCHCRVDNKQSAVITSPNTAPRMNRQSMMPSLDSLEPTGGWFIRSSGKKQYYLQNKIY